MIRTVAQVLSNADASVALINDINTNGNESVYVPVNEDQQGINSIVQRNVDHLELILNYTDPDVAGSSEDKSS